MFCVFVFYMTMFVVYVYIFLYFWWICYSLVVLLSLIANVTAHMLCMCVWHVYNQSLLCDITCCVCEHWYNSALVLLQCSLQMVAQLRLLIMAQHSGYVISHDSNNSLDILRYFSFFLHLSTHKTEISENGIQVGRTERQLDLLLWLSSIQTWHDSKQLLNRIPSKLQSISS